MPKKINNHHYLQKVSFLSTFLVDSKLCKIMPLLAVVARLSVSVSVVMVVF